MLNTFNLQVKNHFRCIKNFIGLTYSNMDFCHTLNGMAHGMRKQIEEKRIWRMEKVQKKI